MLFANGSATVYYDFYEEKTADGARSGAHSKWVCYLRRSRHRHDQAAPVRRSLAAMRPMRFAWRRE